MQDEDDKILQKRRGNPADPSTYLEMGVLLLQQNKLDEALHELNIYTRIWPVDPYSYLLLGTIWEVKGNLEKALDMYNQGIPFAPRSPDLYEGLGRVLMALGQTKKGEIALKKARIFSKNAGSST